MNLRDLQYVSAVAKFGHFGQAAQSCHVSQPALSAQIRKLEAELGVALFERDNRSVRITDIGQQIVALAEQVLDGAERIRSAAETARDPLSGDFRLGSIPTIAPFMLPWFLTAARTAFPRLQVKFQEDITENLNQALLDGDLDAAILATPPDHARLCAIPLYDEPFWVIYPRGHPLAKAAHIQTEDLPVSELLLLTEGHCFSDQAVDVCALGTASRSKAVRATSLQTLINMTEAGQGITLVPAMAVQSQWLQSAALGAAKLGDPKAFRRIYLTHRKSFPRRVLLEHVAEMIRTQAPVYIEPR